MKNLAKNERTLAAGYCIGCREIIGFNSETEDYECSGCGALYIIKNNTFQLVDAKDLDFNFGTWRDPEELADDWLADNEIEREFKSSSEKTLETCGVLDNNLTRV